MNLLIYRIGQLGDTVMALPAMWAVRNHFPRARLTLLSDRHPRRRLISAADLLKGSGVVDEFMSYRVDASRKGKMMGLVRLPLLLIALRMKRFDGIVYLAPSARTPAQVARDREFFQLAGLKQFFGMSGFSPASPKCHGKPLVATLAEADLLLARLAADGIPVPSPGRGSLELGLGAAEAEAVQRWVQESPSDGRRPWVGVAPGSKMPAKRWPLDRFAEVVGKLVHEFDVWPVVFGGPEDARSGAELIKAWGRGANAAGALHVRAAACALQRCLLFVGNDTGTMHLAASVATPVVAVFSARAAPGTWFPYGVEQRVFRSAVECEGCGLTECVERHNECLERISPAEVTAACHDLLSKRITYQL